MFGGPRWLKIRIVGSYLRWIDVLLTSAKGLATTSGCQIANIFHIVSNIGLIYGGRTSDAVDDLVGDVPHQDHK